MEKYNKILFEWLAPLFIGIGIGFPILAVFKVNGIIAGLIWLIISWSGIILYVFRVAYWRRKYEEKYENR